MATKKSTRPPSARTRRALAGIGISEAAQKAIARRDAARDAHQEAHELHVGIWNQLSTLQLVYRVVDHLENTLTGDDELSAVRNQLERTLQEIEDMRTRADDLTSLLFRQKSRRLAA